MIPRIAAIALAFLAGCSVLPPSEYPPYEDHYLEVLYELDAGAERRLEVPASGIDLTIYELRTDPSDIPETFEQGRRWLVPPPDVDTVTLRVRYRTFAVGEDPARAQEKLFPGATLIRPLQ